VVVIFSKNRQVKPAGFLFVYFLDSFSAVYYTERLTLASLPFGCAGYRYFVINDSDEQSAL
jgi:hypothetical protein